MWTLARTCDVREGAVAAARGATFTPARSHPAASARRYAPARASSQSASDVKPTITASIQYWERTASRASL